MGSHKKVCFKCYSFQVFIPLKVSTFFTVFYNDTYSFLQGFNYLITYPRGNCFHLHNTALQLFQLFGIFFFSNDNRNIYFISKRFPLYLANPIRAFIIRRASKKFFLAGLQSSSLRKDASFSSRSFPSLFRRTRHGGVGQRSGTGLETPLLGWALSLKILNHVSLGVDVPVFFHPGDVASFSYFFSLFRYTLNGYLKNIQLQIY